MAKPISITTFDGIADLDDDQINLIIARVGFDELAVCLKAVTDRLKNRIIQCVTEKDRALITEYMEYLGPMRLSEVQYRQGLIVQKFSGGTTSTDPFV